MRSLRRIIALAAIVCTLISLASCNGKHKELKPFLDAISNSSPKSAVVVTKIDTNLGAVGGDYSASYSGNEITVDCTKNAPTAITGGQNISWAVKSTVVIKKDGSVNGEIGALVKSVLMLDINPDGDYITYNLNGDVLEFTVLSKKTDRVFGVDIAYDTSVLLIIEGGKVKSVYVSYTSDSGPATLVCEYTY